MKRQDLEVKRIRRAFSLALLAGAMFACQPKVGSEAWCKAMNEKPKGDWTVNEAADFAKSCIIK
ncbi:MAG TPA: DUF3012 domain-containing protein [Gammaproteobacteria bacterium]|nr:DUF3012 domain-containing protein [Gammaproteobacteria bacterium]